MRCFKTNETIAKDIKLKRIIISASFIWGVIFGLGVVKGKLRGFELFLVQTLRKHSRHPKIHDGVLNG